MMRFRYQNLNGINPDNDLADFEALMHQMIYNAPDFLLFNELNLELNFPEMESKLREKRKEIDWMAKMNLAKGAEDTGLEFRQYRPRGSIQILIGTISRRMNEKGQDKYGRWAWTKI